MQLTWSKAWGWTWDAWASPQEVAYRSGAASRFSVPALVRGAVKGAQHSASQLQGALLGAQAALGQRVQPPAQVRAAWAYVQELVPHSRQGSSR
jgi:hypothetical protein